jgi:DNA excision repair protein ERCC-4
VEPVTLVIDTREQEPYSFDPSRAAAVRHALPAGDYSVQGYEQAVAVERKTMEDFVSTVIRSRRRFHRELRLLAGYEAACVVVEADLADVLRGRYRSDAHPNALLGAVVSIVVDFGVPVYFCSSRQAACRFVLEYLLRFYRRAITP